MSKVTEFDRQKAANNFRANLQQQLDHPAIRKDSPPVQTPIANADANKATSGEFERLETGQGNVPLMNTNARYREEMTALFIQMEKEWNIEYRKRNFYEKLRSSLSEDILEIVKYVNDYSLLWW